MKATTTIALLVSCAVLTGLALGIIDRHRASAPGAPAPTPDYTRIIFVTPATAVLLPQNTCGRTPAAFRCAVGDRLAISLPTPAKMHDSLLGHWFHINTLPPIGCWSGDYSLVWEPADVAAIHLDFERRRCGDSSDDVPLDVNVQITQEWRQ